MYLTIDFFMKINHLWVKKCKFCNALIKRWDKNLANVILKRKERVKYNSFKACLEELIQLSADHIVKQHNRFWLEVLVRGRGFG